MIKLFTFDLTNTLLKFKRPVSSVYVEIASQHGVNFTEDQVSSIFKKSIKHLRQELPIYGSLHGISSIEWWSKVVKQCFTTLDSSIPDKTIDEISKDLYKHFSNGIAYQTLPYAHEVLKTLKKSFSIGVISNADRRYLKIIEDLDLAPYFDFVVISEFAKVSKPSPQIFQIALEKAEVDASLACHIGDDYVKDYLGAKNAKWKAILLAPNDCPQEVPENEKINSLKDILSRLHLFTS